jgi:outer membrane protein assembly factor BamB
VPINAVCPECQNRFRLQDAMLGKMMRCPVCHEAFVVRDAGGPAPASAPPTTVEKPPGPDAPGRTRTDAPPVVSRTGNVSDFVPVIKDVAPVQPPRPPAPPPAAPPAKPREPTRVDQIPPPRPEDFPWEAGARAKPIPKPGPKEMTWSPDLDPLDHRTPPAPAAPQYEADDEWEGDVEEPEYDEVQRPKPASPPPRRKRRRVALLVSMIAFSLTALGAGGYFLLKYINEAPQRLHDAAEKEYAANNFDQARKLYAELAREHPSHELAAKARFFADLSELRQSVSSVLTRSDPTQAVAQWNKFVTSLDDPAIGPFAAKDRFGIDVWQTGSKLAEDVVAKATEVFSEDDPKATEDWLSQAAAIDKALDRFRPDDVPKSESVARDIAALHGRIETARNRLAGLARLRQIMEAEAEDSVEQARRLAVTMGLDRDRGFTAILEESERKIQSKATYTKEPQPIRPVAVPDDGLTSLLFAPRFDRMERRGLAGPTTVFTCLARGVLYALDEEGGKVLWAARTGLDTDVMPVHIAASDQNPEMVLLASNTGQQFGITARGARDGRPLWHQPLAAPCRGMPVVVGPSVFVSLGDPDGTVVEITLTTGDRVGRITIGRALGPQIVARAGSGQLYIPADSQAVYVFDVDRRDPQTQLRLDPGLIGAMTTGHSRGSLRGVPVFSNPDPNDPGPKYFVLGMAEGLDTMKLQAFKLPEDPNARPESNPFGKPISLPGWASFPPYCDGEKVAVVTDKGEFGLYGLALEKNKDDALFVFTSRPAKPGETRPSRGQVVLAEEGSYWVLAGGELRRLRFGINDVEGVRLVPYGDPIPAGEPLHAPQVNARRDTFVVVTQDGMNCRATAVDALTGQLRWRRELGLIAKGDPIKLGESVVILDQGGGFFKIDPKPLADRGGAAWLVDEKWVIAPPANGYTPATGLIPGPANTAIAVLTGESENQGKLLVRILNGDRVEERAVAAPGTLAGRAIVSGRMLILPLSNGSLYRLALADGKQLEEGPTWRAERLPTTSICYLTPINDEELFASDGARGMIRWQWESTSKRFGMQGRLMLTERVGANPVVLPGSPPRLVIADVRGNLNVWDAYTLKPPILKSWRPGERNGPPGGQITDGLWLEGTGEQARIMYAVGGRLVCLNPDEAAPKWVGPEPLKAAEGRAFIDGKRILLTDRAGVVRVLDAETGKETGEEFRLTGSHAFASAAVPVGGNRILVPLADGTVVLGELKKR